MPEQLPFYFNSRGQVKEPLLISGDNTISNEIIEYLIKKNNDFDFSIIKDEWRKEHYIELSKKLEKEGYLKWKRKFLLKLPRAMYMSPEKLSISSSARVMS